MSKLTFTPTNYIGWGSLQHLLVEVKKFEAKNILIVTDPLLKELGIVEHINKPLQEWLSYDPLY